MSTQARSGWRLPASKMAPWNLAALTVCTVALLVGCTDSNTSPPPRVVTPASVALAPMPAVPSDTDKAEEKVLNFSNWPDYMPEGLIAAFERESGIKVNARIYNTNEELMDRLASGKSGDDLVVPGSNFAAMQIEQGLLRPLDRARLANLANLEPALLASLAAMDPGNRHLVPWAWGYTTVGINTTQVQQALGNTPLPDNAWDLVFNPVYTRSLQKCGIAFLDSPTEIIPAALRYLGKPADASAPEDLKAVGDLLTKVRPHIKMFGSPLIDELASGKACVVLGWSGDMSSAMAQAKEDGSKDDYTVLMPSTGALIFVDTLAIPTTAQHPNNAQAFIDFYLRPENAAMMSNELNYPTGNKAAAAKIQPEVLANEAIFPKEANFKKLASPSKLGMKARIAMTQTYVQFAYGLASK